MKVSFDTFLNWSLGISCVFAAVAYALRRFYEARNPASANLQEVKPHEAGQPACAKEATDGPHDIHPVRAAQRP